MKDVEKLEKVQKFALRLCVKQWDLDYVSICDLPTLAARRKYFNLCETAVTEAAVEGDGTRSLLSCSCQFRARNVCTWRRAAV